ncbi:PREDICTED: uncharacterized protein LOC105142199 [Populus euphratica]|uniref:Uncharacterized protein LOC105113526 n=1 Tax=Populus euphratica TaxID=75702 RepID=A0AAJ6TC56_POPEU|nr:PREDICTED: uncharacterized protein LOC105113526 [Populus euphratica]XP_011048021.1 PREDICTED: uncharacterized protein LOC105142199 [Populus euphratica]
MEEVAMEKSVSKSDATNNRLELPMESLSNFPIPNGQNHFEFVAMDMVDRPWEFKVSIRNEGKYKKPWMSGQWGSYAREKRLKQGDRVKLIVQVEGNVVRSYRITAERNLTMGIWIPVEDFAS